MRQTAILSAHQRRSLLFAAIAAGVILAGGLVFAPERAWSNLLVGTFALLTVGLGGTVFVH